MPTMAAAASHLVLLLHSEGYRIVTKHLEFTGDAMEARERFAQGQPVSKQRL